MCAISGGSGEFGESGTAEKSGEAEKLRDVGYPDRFSAFWEFRRSKSPEFLLSSEFALFSAF